MRSVQARPSETEPVPVSSEPRSGLTFVGFSPSSVVMFVATTCAFGILWGAIDRNWVLVATEVPSVLALGAVWVMTRGSETRSDAAKAAAAVGVFCAIELWVATRFFDARGLQLAVFVAASTALASGLGVAYWLWRSHPGDVRAGPR